MSISPLRLPRPADRYDGRDQTELRRALEVFGRQLVNELNAEKPGCIALQSAGLALAAGDNNLTFDSEETDRTSSFDPATGVFTAPRPGMYALNLSATVTGTALDDTNSMTWKVNDVAISVPRIFISFGTEQYGEATDLVYLAEGDAVRPRINVVGGTSPVFFGRAAVAFMS